MIEPRLHLPGCDNLELAIATRRRVIELCIARNALVIPAHFARPHAGWLRREHGAIRFDPLH
jgi:hypothetical protein